MKKLLLTAVIIVSLGLMGCNLLGPNLADESIIVGTWEHELKAVVVLTFNDDGTFILKKDMFGFNQLGTYSLEITGANGNDPNAVIETYGNLIMDIQLNKGEKMHWEGHIRFDDTSRFDYSNAIYPEGWHAGGVYNKI